MTFKQSRMDRGMKQTEMVALMRECGIEITQPVLSMIENNKLDPTVEMSAWLAGMVSETEEPMTQIEETVLDLLNNASRDYPLTREKMRDYTHQADPVNRRAISNLRRRGLWIVSGDLGYYITKDPEELKSWSMKYTAYARSILLTDTAMRRRLVE